MRRVGAGRRAGRRRRPAGRRAAPGGRQRQRGGRQPGGRRRRRVDTWRTTGLEAGQRRQLGLDGGGRGRREGRRVARRLEVVGGQRPERREGGRLGHQVGRGERVAGREGALEVGRRVEQREGGRGTRQAGHRVEGGRQTAGVTPGRHPEPLPRGVRPRRAAYRHVEGAVRPSSCPVETLEEAGRPLRHGARVGDHGMLRTEHVLGVGRCVSGKVTGFLEVLGRGVGSDGSRVQVNLKLCRRPKYNILKHHWLPTVFSERGTKSRNVS